MGVENPVVSLLEPGKMVTAIRFDRFVSIELRIETKPPASNIYIYIYKKSIILMEYFEWFVWLDKNEAP